MRALIIGSNGQDGSYLADALLNNGVEVMGIARQDARYVHHCSYRHILLDIRDSGGLRAALRTYRPSHIYYLAATHGAAGFQYEPVWQDALAVNIGGVHLCLEYLRQEAPQSKLFYASSVKAFGSSPQGAINEATMRRSDCLYSVTKNGATDLIAYYRKHHSLALMVGFFFNHDSPRRPSDFFLPKVARAAANAMCGLKAKVTTKSLNFHCDWGSSREFMEITTQLMMGDCREDVVIASGRSWHAGQLVEELFESIGHDWRDYIEATETSVTRMSEPYSADISKLSSLLGRRPKMDGLRVVQWMAEEFSRCPA